MVKHSIQYLSNRLEHVSNIFNRLVWSARFEVLIKWNFLSSDIRLLQRTKASPSHKVICVKQVKCTWWGMSSTVRTKLWSSVQRTKYFNIAFVLQVEWLVLQTPCKPLKAYAIKNTRELYAIWLPSPWVILPKAIVLQDECVGKNYLSFLDFTCNYERMSGIFVTCSSSLMFNFQGKI